VSTQQETTTVVNPDGEEISEFRGVTVPAVMSALRTVMVALDPIVESKEWLTWDLASQQKLSAVVKRLNDFNTSIRGRFDPVVWENRKNGKLPESVEWVRAPRKDDAETPGRKVTKPTTEEKANAFFNL